MNYSKNEGGIKQLRKMIKSRLITLGLVFAILFAAVPLAFADSEPNDPCSQAESGGEGTHN